MYEIVKRSTTNPNIYQTVAYTDLKEWADKIIDLLNLYTNDEFSIDDNEKTRR